MTADGYGVGPSMTTEGALVLAIVSNGLIALSYLVLALVFGTKFDSAAPTWALVAFRVAAGGWFIGCGLTHIHAMEHIWLGIVDDPTSWHYLAIHVPQALAAVVGAGLGACAISLKVFDRTYYNGFLERALELEARRVAEQLRREDVEAARLAAGRVAEMADLVITAMRSERAAGGI